MADVQHLFTCLVHRFPMREESAVEAIKNKGLKGCIHGRPDSKRQVLLMDRETLDKFGLPPGAIKENVTVAGIDFQTLGSGATVESWRELAGDYSAVRPVPADGRDSDGIAAGIARAAWVVVPSGGERDNSEGRCGGRDVGRCGRSKLELKSGDRE